MKKLVLLLFGVVLSSSAQELPVRWDELAASDWNKALEKSNRTCILPMGVLEKHGPHCPVGTDLITVRELTALAAKKEYAVVFPDFYFGQIYEARHRPGAFAPPAELVLEVLQATCDEIARNGFEKILIINGHGGNGSLIPYFIQTQLHEQKPYAVFFHDPKPDSAFNAEMRKMRKTDPANDGHAGEEETSMMLYLRPELVKQDRAADESGINQKRLALPGVYTAVWWYAAYPNHYAGDGTKGSAQLGKFVTDHDVEAIVRSIRLVKADAKTLELQEEFFKKGKHLME
jgi:creatinine amidohydrolase